MKPLQIDLNYTLDILLRLLNTPSPSGFTDMAVHRVAQELEQLEIPFELTRRGAIRATLKGKRSSPDRALVAHIDTLGAMIKGLKANGRCELIPVGHWNGRFAEGARVTLFSDSGRYRGTIVPLKASGHAYGEEVDKQPSGWDYVELRLDELCFSLNDLMRLNINVGDFVTVDSQPEITATGFINARHLDDKAGAAALLAAIKAVKAANVQLPVDCHPLFTISEEVGSGASAALHQDVAEMITIDNGVVAPTQNSHELGVTIAMADMSGPFDYHLSRRLIQICQEFGIRYQRDVFKYYRSDSAAAIEAGNDLRTALLTFGVDGSHGYERTHCDALESLGKLLTLYMQSPVMYRRDRHDMGSRMGFPTLPI